MRQEGLAISGGSPKEGETEEQSRADAKRKERGNGERKKSPFASASPATDKLDNAPKPSKGNGKTKGNGKKKNGVKSEEELRAAILKERQASSRRVIELASGQDPAVFVRAYSSASVIQLFDSWASSYDHHMDSTGHDPAVQNLLKQAHELHKLSRDTHGWPIFGRRGAELSCGTGTPIMFLSQIIPPDEFGKMRIIANDISSKMQELARAKLGGLDCKIDYTQHDVRSLPFNPGSFDTAMLINTIPFLTDPRLLYQENLEGKSNDEDNEHRHVKRMTLKRVMDILPWNGHLIVVDEWPAKYTTRGDAHLTESEIHRMFDENARPIDNRATFRDKVMKNVPGARFVAELKARIDRYHSMYIFIYRKDEDKIKNRYRLLPDSEEEAARAQLDLTTIAHARREAVDRVVASFRAIDPHFVNFYKPINGEIANWADFLPICDGSVFDSRDPSTAGEMGSHYNTAIVAGVLHNLSDEQRMTMLTNVVSSLNRGGALMIIDEWEPPVSSPHPIAKRTLRDTVIEEFRQKLMFEGAIRETILPGFDSGVYGYMFRKKF